MQRGDTGCFQEILVRGHPVRAISLDTNNTGGKRCGIRIESPEVTGDAIAKCDAILATGSTIVNGSIVQCLACFPPI